MKKIWLESYPPGVPATVDVTAYASLGELFDRTVTRFRDRPAFANMGVSMSYGELDRATRDFAAYLTGELGLRQGDRVAIMMPNLLQYPVALFGTLRAGLTVVNVNPLYTARELEHQLCDSGASVVVILANFASTLAEVVSRTPVRHVVVTELGDLFPFPKRLIVNLVVKHVKKLVKPFSLPGSHTFREALAKGHERPFQPAALTHDDVAFLQYTGGTTGVAKGAVLTHGNMVANLQQVSAWLGAKLIDGQEIVITALPLYHIFSLTANCLTFAKHGGLNVLITNPKDLPAFVQDLSRYRFTAMTGVNTLFNALVARPDFAQLDFSALKISVGGGMAVQRVVAEKWKKITGNTLCEGYGLTEASPVCCVNPLDLAEYSAAIGLPLPSTEVSIRDDAGHEVDASGRGELWIRGPQVMRGYWNRPEDTKEMLDDEGWLHTGDVATIDEKGYVRIVDRKKDMVLVSGFNVYPNEIEDVVASHPDVLECAVIGVPDEKSGEAVKLFVVPRSSSLTESKLRDFCKEQLTGYKLPKYIEFRTELPKTNVGKILRRALRDTPPAAGNGS